MHFRTTGLLLLGAMALPASAIAHTMSRTAGCSFFPQQLTSSDQPVTSDKCRLC
jgi:hypothetical protein